MSTNNTEQQKQFSQLSMQQKIDSEQVTQVSQNQAVRLHRHYGNMIPIMIDPITKVPKYLLGPHFYVFIIALIVAMGVFFYIVKQLIGRTNQWVSFLSIILGINFGFTYIKIGFSDPGIASRIDMPEPSLRASPKYCVPCRIVRSPGTSHCYYCDICIQGLDHHCPWVGKCIGRKNLCLFYKFLISIALLLGTLLVAALTSASNQSTYSAVVKI